MSPIWAIAPTIKYPDEFALIQDNSAISYQIPQNSVKIATLGDLLAEDEILFKQNQIREKYPDLANLLICMWKKESTYGLDDRRGDHGLAVGDFQIHIDKHPVLESCALNFNCALDYTAKSIQKGHGWWWSSYYKCGGK